MKIPGDFEFDEYIGQKWLNSEGKETWIQEVNAQTTERCIRQCLRTRSGTEICVGYTFNVQDKRCYLKSVNDAIELEDSDEFTSGRIVIGNSTVVPGFRVVGFRALPGFRALNPGNGGWSVHKTLFGFRAPLSSSF